MVNSDIVSICVDHYLFIGLLTIAVKIRNPVTSQRCFRSLSEIRIPPRALHRSWPVSLSLVSLSLDFHSFTFLYLAFILSVYSYFSFYSICLFFYHTPISWVLVLLSTCVSFSPCRGAYDPTALQAHAAPVLSLCFPAFQSCCHTRSFSYLSPFLSVLRAFALPSSLLPPPGSLHGYKKIPSRGLCSRRGSAFHMGLVYCS